MRSLGAVCGFIFCVCFLMYYLCERNHKPITAHYYIADDVSSVSRLSLLDLGTNQTYEHALETELTPM